MKQWVKITEKLVVDVYPYMEISMVSAKDGFYNLYGRYEGGYKRLIAQWLDYREAILAIDNVRR